MVTRNSLRRGPRPRDLEACFALLDPSRFAETRWQVVYDLSSPTMSVKAGRSQPLAIELARLVTMNLAIFAAYA